MAKRDILEEDQETQPRLNIAALIDMSFLLLIYFMVSTTLLKQEADLGIILPGIASEGSEPVEVDQMAIAVDPAGTILVNGEVVDTEVNRHGVPELRERLKRYRAVAELAGSEPLVIIQCAGGVAQQRFVDVLNACASVGIRHVSLTQ